MDALDKAEGQFRRQDDAFAEDLVEEIDRVFREFGLLKQLMKSAQRGDIDAKMELDAASLKAKLQLNINDIIERIDTRQLQHASPHQESITTTTATAAATTTTRTTATPRPCTAKQPQITKIT